MYRGKLFWLFFLFAAACGRDPAFQVQACSQADRLGVRLNEVLVLRFSQEVDFSSVTADSLSIVDQHAKSALGRWDVRGKELRFYPRTPVAEDCSDSGLKAGRTYRISLLGFPAYCALQSTSGQRLEKGRSFTFHTVGEAVTGLGRFVDARPESGPSLLSVGGEALGRISFDGIRIPAGQKLRLCFSESLYPASVLKVPSRMNRVDPDAMLNQENEILNLVCTLENGSEDHCLVSIEPEGGFKENHEYKLWREMLAFSDFGGNAIGTTSFEYIWISCVPAQAADPEG